MGQVIALPPPRKIASCAPEGGSAAILFFTGVRYYRLSDEEFAALSGSRARRFAEPKANGKLARKTAPAARKLKRQA